MAVLRNGRQLTHLTPFASYRPHLATPCIPPCSANPLQSDWGVVQRGYYAHVLGEAPHYFKDPVEAVRTLKKGNRVSGEGAVRV